MRAIQPVHRVTNNALTFLLIKIINICIDNIKKASDTFQNLLGSLRIVKNLSKHSKNL